MDIHLSFLVDVNLPKYFSFFNNADFIFVSDINLQMTDTEIGSSKLIIAKETHIESIR